MLRKFYDSRLRKALILVLVVFAAISILLLTVKTTFKKNLVFIGDTRLYNLPPTEVDHKKEVVKVPAKPKQPAVVKNLNTQTFVAKVKIVDNNIATTKLPDNLDSAEISNETHKGTPGAKPLVKVPAGPVTTVTGTGGIIPKLVDKSMVTDKAEVMPAYPGGMDALRTFLQNNLSNPQDIEPGGEVSVKVKFVVGYDGKLKGFEIVENGGTAFNNEVIRVLKKMPEWIPGKNGGENVSVYYTIPVKFIAQE